MRRILLPLFALAVAVPGAPACDDETPAQVAPDATSDSGLDATSDGTADGGEDAVSQCEPPNGLRPSRRSEHDGIYDPVRNRVIIYGGSFAIPVNCNFPAATFEPETWAYDVACDRWEEIASDGGPGGRVRHMTAYDSARDRMIVFGGRYRAGDSGVYTLYNDMWALDLATDTWSNVTLSDANVPSPRVNGAFAYDPQGDRLILFGGNTSADGAAYNSQSDVWEFDFATSAWTMLQPSGPGPAQRLFHSGFWDASRQWLVIHGGSGNDGFFNPNYFADLWALDFSNGTPAWARLDVGAGPVPDGRFWGRMVHDTANDRYILAAGHDGGDLGNRNDLWVFSPTALGWSAVDVGDQFNAPALGFCSFPPDFTTVVAELPERRNAHVFVAGPDGAFMTGGKTDCGAVDDLWRLNFSDLSFEELTIATVGEACIRRTGTADNCTDMCL